MIRLAATLVTAVLLNLSIAPAGAFEGDTMALGGPGGQPFHDQCSAGEAIIGITWETGKDLNLVRGVCSPLADGLPTGEKHYLSWRGKSHNGEAFKFSDTAMCVSGMVMQALHATESKVLLVHNFWMTCRNLVTGEVYETDVTSTNGGKGGHPGFVDCGTGAYVSGLLGGAYDNVDRLGIICTVHRPKVVNTPPPVVEPPPPPKPDKPPLDVNNGGTGGASASAATDTSIYDKPSGTEVDYLSAGDPVTIMTCKPNNWCHISAPADGWVWGDDLDR